MFNNSEQTQYMSWNGTNRHVANNIDHIADKISFTTEMIDNSLLNFDAIEKELMAMSTAQVPPQPANLSAMAYRINSSQVQLKNALCKIRELNKDIDRLTDVIQGGNNGWR